MYLGELNVTIFNSLGMLNRYMYILMCDMCVCNYITYIYNYDVRWAHTQRLHPYVNGIKIPIPKFSADPPSFLLFLFLFLSSSSFFDSKLSLTLQWGFCLVFLHFGGLKGQTTQNAQHEGCRAQWGLRVGILQSPIEWSWLFCDGCPNPFWLGKLVDFSESFLKVCLEF